MTAVALRRAVLGCHLTLAAAVIAMAATRASVWSAAIGALALLPLAATLPGLVAGRRRTGSWAALVAVLYAGAATVEVVASAGAARFALLALLASLGELALLFTLSRRRAGDSG